MDRTKRFRGIADIGYCASKKIVFKLHLQVTDQGLPMGYVVNEASCHDRMAAETVMAQILHPYNLGGQRMHQPKIIKGAVQRASSRFLDTRSKKSANSPIRLMETVDETKTQSDGNRVFDFRRFVSDHRDSSSKLGFGI
jgi:hypothetical protein